MTVEVPSECSREGCSEPVIVGLGQGDAGPVEWLCRQHFAEAMQLIGHRVEFLVRRIAAARSNGGGRSS